MPHMTIMRGGPGSGKSSLAEQMAAVSLHEVVVCSADDFYINDKGVYRFDPKLLGRAHGECLKKCIFSVTANKHVIIDNTNSRPEELLPYLAVCQAFDYSCSVVRAVCDLEVAWERQTHAVPREIFERIFTSVMQHQVPSLFRDAMWLTIRDVSTDGKVRCNCGVSTGVRSDHESQCAAAYPRADR